jgi:hypothetical protein
MGYTLVGLVTSEDQKQHLRKHAGYDWDSLPMMEIVHTRNENANEGDICTIEVDMIERRAELYHSSKCSEQRLEPVKVWADLPERVWIGVAFKRNSGREAVLMPCIHWNMRTA